MPRVITTLTTLACLALASSAAPQVLASESDRKEAIEHYRAGHELLSAEQFEKAAEAFRVAIKHDPLLTDAHFGLGQSYMGLQRYASAIQAFQGCIEAARTFDSLRQKNRAATDRAIDEEIRELRDSVRRVASGHVRVAQPNIKVTQLEQRIDELERSRSSMGTRFEPPATVLLSLGSAYFRNGNREGAAKNWAEAVRVNSTLGEAWNNLAVIYLGSGRKSDAENAVKNAERAGFRVNPRLKDDIKAMK
jgi:tetratricopeptide (TPR) repeat protein